MSHLKPKRSRSAHASRFEAVSAAIAELMPKCSAMIVELPIGALILMGCPAAARCPRCDDARRRQNSRDVGPAAKPTPPANVTSSEEE